MLNDIQKSILKTVSDMTGIPDGAVNIRLDGQKAFRQNSEHIQIVSKTDKDGIDIKIAPFTKSENVHIPVVLSKAGFHDMVYNDFFVGEGADVTIVAGCGIHNCGDCDSEHDGIHTLPRRASLTKPRLAAVSGQLRLTTWHSPKASSRVAFFTWGGRAEGSLLVTAQISMPKAERMRATACPMLPKPTMAARLPASSIRGQEV